jgi:hypothetical protein
LQALDQSLHATYGAKLFETNCFNRDLPRVSEITLATAIEKISNDLAWLIRA